VSVFGQLYIVPAMTLALGYCAGEITERVVAGVDGAAPGSSKDEGVGMYVFLPPDSGQRLSA
jgi:hypothetical protein